MAKQTDIRVLEAVSSTQHIAYRVPMKFGGRVVHDVTLFNVRLNVETRAGKRGSGFGSMPLGNVWAWPSKNESTQNTLAAMLTFAEEAAQAVCCSETWGHPLELAHQLGHQFAGIAEDVNKRLGCLEAMPKLAQLVAASPIDAALHDAFGRTHQANAYRLLGAEFVSQDLSAWLGKPFAGEYLDRYVRTSPSAEIPLYHLVGALDPISDSEPFERANDGLPELLEEWIEADGLSHLKIKLNGDDLAWDVDRVLSVNEVVNKAKSNDLVWQFSLDFNEKCENEAYVLEFLSKIRERSSQAFDRVQYIEQPTHRDLHLHPDQTMHEVAKLKPVVIDESLVDLESLELALERGYSGIALKACKGHSEALLMGAVAQKKKCFLCVQDLTCVGASFLHSSSLAAWLPTVKAIEGNGRQYCPLGNQDWDKAYPSMFEIGSGTVGTHALSENGLGFSWPKDF